VGIYSLTESRRKTHPNVLDVLEGDREDIHQAHLHPPACALGHGAEEVVDVLRGRLVQFLDPRAGSVYGVERYVVTWGTSFQGGGMDGLAAGTNLYEQKNAKH